MLKKLFGRRSDSAAAPPAPAPAQDDLVAGARLAASELLPRLMQAMTTERGVHAESILGALGSLAGYACQASVRARARAAGLDELAHFAQAEGADGKTYLFGDALNRPLAEDRLSVWSLAAGTAQSLGCQQIPPVEEVFRHVTSTVGTPEFGRPRLAEGHPIHDTPAYYVETFWPNAFALVNKICPLPEQWPIAFGLAIQDLMQKTKGVLDPAIALGIVMECAVPMSKLPRPLA